MTESSSSTAIALLDAAEIVFATEGVDNASLRSIMRQAGSNPAAVHYHYGSRNELARAVLDRILAPLQDRRLMLLNDLCDIHADQPPINGLIEALVRPDLEAFLAIGQRNPHGARLIGAIYTRPSSFVKSFVEESFSPVAQVFTPHLLRALPELGPEELAWRIRWAVFGTVGALLSDDEATLTEENVEAELAKLLATSIGALTAPPAKEMTT